MYICALQPDERRRLRAIWMPRYTFHRYNSIEFVLHASGSKNGYDMRMGRRNPYVKSPMIGDVIQG